MSAVVVKKEWFILGKSGTPYLDYVKKELIGNGAYGQVFKAVLKNNNVTRVIKVIHKAAVSDKIRLVSQVTLLRTVDHPNLVRLYEIYEDQHSLYLVMEYCAGGDLYDQLMQEQSFKEEKAKKIFRDMVSAIHYCHSKNIAHRDIKLQNFMLGEGGIKLTDFGLSIEVKDSLKRMKSCVGTVYYIAPEVLSNNYTLSCDIWSLGVVLYMLLMGKAPFNGSTDNKIYSSIKSLTLPQQSMQQIPVQARDLILRCLSAADQRITTKQMLQHPWLLKSQPSTKLSTAHCLRLKQYKNSSKLKQIMLQIICSQLKSKQILSLAKMFKQIDTDQSGTLSLNELVQSLPTKEQPQAKGIFATLDSDSNKEVSYNEFLAAVIDPNVYLDSANLKHVFRIFDTNHNGMIEVEEIKKVLGHEENNSCDERVWEEMLRGTELKKQGKISFRELHALLAK